MARTTHFIIGLLTAALLFGCGQATMADSGAENGAAYASKSGSSGGSSSSSGGSYYSADAGSSQGQPNPGFGTGAADQDGTGIGLKPGGAQDIGFFRQQVGAGKIPQPGDMKLTGWLNEHDTKLPSPDKKRTIDLHAMAAVVQGPNGNMEAALQLGFNSGKDLSDVDTQIALCVVVDRSGSMGGSRIAYVKAGLHKLLDNLPADTVLSLVSFSNTATTDWAPKTYGPADKAALKAKIDALKASGGTNLYDGLKLCGEHARKSNADDKGRRVILLSDGQPTKGNTKHADIVALAGQLQQQGVSVSSVGVGTGFNPKLMTEIAEQGDGTAWFLQNVKQAEDVFINDLITMLVPVGKDLKIAFEMAKGWKVTDIYGFDWVQDGNKVTVIGPAKPQDPVGSSSGGSSSGSSSSGGSGGEKHAMPTLFASNKNALVMVRIEAPAGLKAADVTDLALAKVQYSFALVKSDKTESYTEAVQVPGLVAIPDGGVAYFADPIVCRAFVLLHAGLALRDSVQHWADGKDKEAKATIETARKLIATHHKSIPAAIDLDPGLPDADKLLATLAGLFAGN